MRPQLIQQKVLLGSQVTFTLKTGEKVSGLLAEIGIDYITLNGANGQEILDVDEIKRIHRPKPVEESESSAPTPVSTSADEPSDITPVPTGGKLQPGHNQTLSTSDTPSVPTQEHEPPDTTPVSTQEHESSDPPPDHTDSVDFEAQVSEKLVEIEKRFNTETGAAKLELEPPDLTFSKIVKDLKNWQNTDVYSKWVPIRDKYKYALKIGELSAKFGRIQPIVTDLKSLIIRFPESITLKRTLAYFYSISDNWDEALQNYQEAAVQSKEANDWFEVAVSALKLNKEELACYSLAKFFYGVSIIDEPKAWDVYVNLLAKFNNLPAFRELCKTDKYDIGDEVLKVLLDTAMYLLQKTGAAELAIGIIQKRLAGESAKSLLGEACQQLDGQPAESYRQFFTEFMQSMIASEKKPARPTPQHLVHRKTPQKQKPQTQTGHGGEALYREAERADQSGDLQSAETQYRKCIGQNIRRDSAIKNLAMVLVRLERPEEAVELLEENRPKVKDKQALDNMLITVYPAAAQYEKAIELLKDRLSQPGQNPEKRAQIRWQLASAYINLEDYRNAESQFHQVLRLRPDNITARRNLALCLSKQERYGEAEQILNRIQNASPDAKTADLLEAVEKAKTTGEFILNDDSISEIEIAFSYFSGDLSEFAQFFLDRCTFEGIPTGRVNDGKYTGSEKDARYDIARLEDIAKQLGTKSPRDRSNYYLSASRIYVDVGSHRNFFYRYLCRSFASRGDAAVSENRNLDTVREWYCEALTVYDGNRSRHRMYEQDAVNSLVRYLYSTLGHAHIDLAPKIPSIDEAVRNVVSNHPDRKQVFDAIVYLVLHSRYAAGKVLRGLYYDETLRAKALNYLAEMQITIPDAIEHFSDFVIPWDELRNEKFKRARTISNELQFLNNFELTTAWLEDNIRLAENIRLNLFFQLDQQRVGELRSILETALELCKQGTFEERERLCRQLQASCQGQLREIEESPTRLSVKDVYPIIEVIQKKVNAYLEDLYVTSKPQMTLRLPMESYVPDTDRNIEVQLVVQNEVGRSPAESLELVIEDAPTFFTVTEPDIKRDESLRGGERSILKVPLRVTDQALDSQTFSLPVYARYLTREGEQEQTQVENLPIRLYSEDEFETIENPYASYAEGGIVGDPAMFFGRDELIQNIAQAIQESRLQSKCVLVFGQKRSGKSSVLYHLKKALEKDRKLLILDLENIGVIQDENSSVPLLYQILKRILTVLDDAIEDRADEDFPPLNISIPDDTEFYNHPAPLQRFEDTFRNFKRQISNQEDWRGVRAVLLIDEFQYIYDRIVAGEISELFMKNWKALLQANYFNAVLVGQDVMPKFKLSFSNEFGTTQDERVTYLKPDDARQLIDEPIRIEGRQGASRYREQAIERILELTAGSPFYIQMLCNRLVEYMNVKHAGLVTEADVEQVKNELIRGVNALDLDKFDNLINSGDTSADAISDDDALKVLKAIADNSRTGPCHRDSIDCQTSLPVDTILEDLVKRDVVKREQGQYYQIHVGLFKEWLIANG